MLTALLWWVSHEQYSPYVHIHLLTPPSPISSPHHSEQEYLIVDQAHDMHIRLVYEVIQSPPSASIATQHRRLYSRYMVSI